MVTIWYTVPAGSYELMTSAASVHEADVHVYWCRVNLVLVGAEGVVENGGIINKLGSYHVAIAAKEHGIPFYVAAESYKVMFNSGLFYRRTLFSIALHSHSELSGCLLNFAVCVAVACDD